jgi:hypothetical protein
MTIWLFVAAEEMNKHLREVRPEWFVQQRRIALMATQPTAACLVSNGHLEISTKQTNE